MARITGWTCGSKIAKTIFLECGTDLMLVESCGRQGLANNTTNTSATSTSALFSVNISTLVMNTRITITMAACSIDGIHQTCQSSTVHSSCLVKARPSRRHVQHAARLDEQLNSERPSGAAHYLKMQITFGIFTATREQDRAKLDLDDRDWSPSQKAPKLVRSCGACGTEARKANHCTRRFHGTKVREATIRMWACSTPLSRPSCTFLGCETTCLAALLEGSWAWRSAPIRLCRFAYLGPLCLQRT